MKNFLIILIFALQTTFVFSQSGGLGLMLGATYYNGDYNKFVPFNPPSFAGGIVYYQELNSYRTVRLQADYGVLKGPSSHQFTTNYFNAGLMFEQNFLPFSTKPSNKAFILVPYCEVGAFFLYAPNNKSTVNMAIPVGLGVKYALSEMAVIALEWNYSFTNTDILDETGTDVDNTFKKLSLKNDYFSFIGVILRYNLFQKDRLCPAYR